MRIRRAEPSDALIIGQIRIRGWRWAYRGLLPAALLLRMSDDGREPQRRDRLRHPPPRTGAWVVEEDGCVVGFALTGPTRDTDADGVVTGEVYALYLEPDATGQGLGRALFTHAVEDLACMGYRRASLWVLASNERARRFYEAAGWHADGAEQVEEMEGAPLREVRYVTELREPVRSRR